jgi:hypothetical protein
MERRSFLKILGALTGGVVLPGAAISLVEAAEVAPAGWGAVGLIREVIAYDISRDQYLVRYDVLTVDGNLQLGVDCTLRRLEKKEVDQNRELCKQVIENELKHRGLTWQDLKPLQMPYGHTNPVLA